MQVTILVGRVFCSVLKYYYFFLFCISFSMHNIQMPSHSYLIERVSIAQCNARGLIMHTYAIHHCGVSFLRCPIASLLLHISLFMQNFQISPHSYLTITPSTIISEISIAKCNARGLIMHTYAIHHLGGTSFQQRPNVPYYFFVLFFNFILNA